MDLEKYNPLDNVMFQVLDPEGNVQDESLLPDLSDEDLLKIYRTMRFSRIIDERMLNWQRQGRMLTYAPNIGQEAAQVGSSWALAKQDWVVGSFRELGAWLNKEVDLAKIMMYWYGNEWGSAMGVEKHIMPVSVPIATHLLHATGIAMAANYRGLDEVAMSYVGDGGTSEGDFHEALNFASVYDAAVVFVVQNNQYAISVPRAKQTKSKNIAMKAVAYGMPGILVDGNDIFAMIAASRAAVEHARSGKGPVLIEAYTYRMGAHTTSDDPTKYREDSEVEKWAPKDPILRLEKYMIAKGLLKEEDIEPMKEELDKIVADTYASIEHSSDTKVEDIFKYHYETMTPQLEEQLADYQAFLEVQSDGK